MQPTNRRRFLGASATGVASLAAGTLHSSEQMAEADQPEAVAADPHAGRDAIEDVSDAMAPRLKAMSDDSAFVSAIETFDVAAFAREFQAFGTSIKTYNAFHRRERRLWSVKIGRGTLDQRREHDFMRTVGAGRDKYLEAFGAMDRIAEQVVASGVFKVLERHLPAFTETLQAPGHPLTQAVTSCFRNIGCSQEMIREFNSEVLAVQPDLINTTAGGFRGLRDFARQGVAAQKAVLDYTERNGFRYVRGRCGPPEWAVVASDILSSMGIVIAAWVLVAVVVVFLAVLLAICLSASPNSSLGRQCRRLDILLPLFQL